MEFNRIPIYKNLCDSFHEDSLTIEFVCPNCKSTLKIDLLEEYSLLEDLVDEGGISNGDVLKNGMANVNSKLYKHLGQFTVYTNLPAYYKNNNCEECGDNYIVVFGFGEIQNGRSLLYVSGVWMIT